MSEIIGFFGGDSQVGVSMISQSVAEILSYECKVLYICSSGNYGDDFFKNKDEKTMDNIKANLLNNSLEYSDIDQILINYGNLSIIPGVRNISTAGYYTCESLKLLIDTVKDKFGYIIIDGGSNPNMGLMISALENAEKRYFIVTQQPKCINRFKNLRNMLLLPMSFKGKVVVNKYIRNLALFNDKEIKLMMETDELMIVPYIEQCWDAEIQQRTFLNFCKYKEAVEKIVYDISGREVTPVGRRIFSGRIFKERRVDRTQRC